jgi:hypothetical protein
MKELGGLMTSARSYAERWRKSERLVGANSNTSSGLESHPFKAGASEMTGVNPFCRLMHTFDDRLLRMVELMGVNLLH